jgi:GTP-binding protein
MSENSASQSAAATAPAIPLPVVAIVGRPNVGKSSIFNRIIGSRRSIVGDLPGITRDRIYGEAEWNGNAFAIVDTGGIVPDDDAIIPSNILKQARAAIEEACLLLFVVDVRAGLSPLDEELAKMLRSVGKPVFVVANKSDTAKVAQSASEFHEFGYEEVFPVSAEHNLGVLELLDAVVEKLPPMEARKWKPREISVAIIGRPNVGKSSLVNKLLGEERVIVSPVAGTTRDAVDTVLTIKLSAKESTEKLPDEISEEITSDDSARETSDDALTADQPQVAESETANEDRDALRLRLIDTAGIRRKGRTELMEEKLSVVMARKHIERADVCLMMIDATEGVTAADATIAGYAHEAGRSIILIVNKWDAVEKDTYTAKAFEEKLRDQMKFLDYAPVVFVSAASGQRVHRLPEMIARADAARSQRITTGQLNQFYREQLEQPRATISSKRPVKVLYLTQASTRPPTFVIFTSARGDRKLHFSWERYLINRLRESFDFYATPIRILQRNRGRKSEK